LLQVQGACAPGTARADPVSTWIEVRAGEVVALMGRNGAGKSTTLKAIMGDGARDSQGGQCALRWAATSRAAAHRVARLGLGYVPEEPAHLHRPERAGEPGSGAPARRATGPTGAAPHWTPERLFKLFPNLGEMPDRPGGRMSGGEQQMLTVARTLMGKPLLVLLDEPSEGVAPADRRADGHMIWR
jgi:branched-chain amino acid transport system ATP-binding protein